MATRVEKYSCDSQDKTLDGQPSRAVGADAFHGTSSIRHRSIMEPLDEPEVKSYEGTASPENPNIKIQSNYESTAADELHTRCSTMLNSS